MLITHNNRINECTSLDFLWPVFNASLLRCCFGAFLFLCRIQIHLLLFYNWIFMIHSSSPISKASILPLVSSLSLFHRLHLIEILLYRVSTVDPLEIHIYKFISDRYNTKIMKIENENFDWKCWARANWTLNNIITDGMFAHLLSFQFISIQCIHFILSKCRDCPIFFILYSWKMGFCL